VNILSLTIGLWMNWRFPSFDGKLSALLWIGRDKSESFGRCQSCLPARSHQFDGRILHNGAMILILSFISNRKSFIAVVSHFWVEMPASAGMTPAIVSCLRMQASPLTPV